MLTRTRTSSCQDSLNTTSTAGNSSSRTSSNKVKMVLTININSSSKANMLTIITKGHNKASKAKAFLTTASRPLGRQSRSLPALSTPILCLASP